MSNVAVSTAENPVSRLVVPGAYAEAFPMTAARAIITAATHEWAMIAGRTMTGYGTSVIACDAEAAIERELSPAETPDPPRVTSCELDHERPGERSDDEEQDRQRRERSGAERALRGLIAGLGGVPAHERHVDAIGDHAIGVDEACDQGERRSQTLRASSLSVQRTRRATDGLFERRETARKLWLYEFIGHGRTSSVSRTLE